MLISLLLYSYIVFASWGGAFALGPWFPIHVLVLLSAFVLSIPRILTDRKFPKGIYRFEDIFICLGLAGIAVSGILHPNEKTLNYLGAYFYIFGIGYLALKFLLYKNTSMDKLFTVNMVTVLFIAAFAAVEVMSGYFLGFDIQTVIPRDRPAGAIYNGVLLRAYGFATEPGTVAFYFNTLGILALWKLWDYKSAHGFLKAFLTGLLALAWICTFSAGGFAFLAVSVIIVLAVRSCDATITKKKVLATTSSNNCRQPTRDYRPAWNKLAILAALLLTVYLIGEHSKLVKYAIEPIVEKVTLQTDEVRLTHWNYAIDNMFENPFFGKGIGYLSSRGEGSSHNWYLFLALEGGFIAAACFVLFLICTFMRILQSKITLKYWFMAGFLAAGLGFLTFSAIHDPFPWILIAIFNVVEQKQKDAQQPQYVFTGTMPLRPKKRVNYAQAGTTAVSD